MRVKTTIGHRQRIGLSIKLSSRVELFLRKMIAKTRNCGSGAKRLASSLRAAISSERRLTILAGANKPDKKPIPNREVAIISHLL